MKSWNMMNSFHNFHVHPDIKIDTNFTFNECSYSINEITQRTTQITFSDIWPIEAKLDRSAFLLLTCIVEV